MNNSYGSLPWRHPFIYEVKIWNCLGLNPKLNYIHIKIIITFYIHALFKLYYTEAFEEEWVKSKYDWGACKIVYRSILASLLSRLIPLFLTGLHICKLSLIQLFSFFIYSTIRARVSNGFWRINHYNITIWKPPSQSEVTPYSI